MIGRWRHLAAAIVFAIGAVLATTAHAEDKVLRVASQKGAATLLLLQQRGLLEEQLKPLGWSVTWTEFPAGPQLLESLNVGATDFGLVGEGPPIFAQAAGADIVYVAAEVPSPASEAIIVPPDSSIRTIEDLKGKRIALNKGSDVNYLLIRALESVGLTYADVEPAYLAPADARAAFEHGAVDAWVIWDPYYAAAEIALKARKIADGAGLAANAGYYMAARQIANQHPEIVKVVLTALDEADAWAKANPGPLTGELSRQLGIPVAVVDAWVRRSDFGVKRIDPNVLAEQQKIADAFAKIHLIPKAITVTDAAWKPQS